jgi:hypothetical protein
MAVPSGRRGKSKAGAIPKEAEPAQWDTQALKLISEKCRGQEGVLPSETNCQKARKVG